LLKKVWLAPALKSSLISISDLDKTGIATLFDSGIGKLLDHQDHSRVYGFARIIGEHYWLNCIGTARLDAKLDANMLQHTVYAVKKPVVISVDLAHRRACHAGEAKVRKMESSAEGVRLKPGTGVVQPCVPCIKGKGRSQPFGKVRAIRTKPGEMLHIDI
jgi:hypothetical protein